jgi:hypothetical protein
MKRSPFFFGGAALLLAFEANAQDQSVAAQPAPPPPPGPTTTVQVQRTERVRRREEEPDPTKKLLWLDAEAGIANANLNTFTEDFNAFAVGFLPRTGTGPMAGAAIGLRLLFLTLGVRGRVTAFEDTSPTHNVRAWNMASLDGELGFRVPLRRWEPYLTLASGYTTFGGFSDAVSGLGNGLNVNGFNARLGFGVDYFVSRYISIGGNLTGELLILTRPGVPVRDITSLPQTRTLEEGAARFLEANGSSYGTALALTGGIKAHF